MFFFLITIFCFVFAACKGERLGATLWRQVVHVPMQGPLRFRARRAGLGGLQPGLRQAAARGHHRPRNILASLSWP